jgi:hypothetical protein
MSSFVFKCTQPQCNNDDQKQLKDDDFQIYKLSKDYINNNTNACCSLIEQEKDDKRNEKTKCFCHTELKFPSNKHYIITNCPQHNLDEMQKTVVDQLEEDLKNYSSIAKQLYCYFLHGSAGSGKTTIVRHILRHGRKCKFFYISIKSILKIKLDDCKQHYFTNNINICALTLAKFFYDYVLTNQFADKSKFLNSFISNDVSEHDIDKYIDDHDINFKFIDSNYPIVIFFDEYSMLNSATACLFFKILNQSLIKHNMYLIFVGDVNQCPPINECTYFPSLIDYCNEKFNSTIKHFYLFNPLRFQDDELKKFIGQISQSLNNAKLAIEDINFTNDISNTKIHIDDPLCPQFTILCKTNMACQDYWHSYIKCISTCFKSICNVYCFQCPIQDSFNDCYLQFFITNMKYYFITNVRDENYRNGRIAIANREECILIKCKVNSLALKCIRTRQIFSLKPIWFIDPWYSKDVKIFGFPIHPSCIDNIFQYQGLTIHNDGYIDFNNCSKDQDIYTAITRFKHNNQIKGLINL